MTNETKHTPGPLRTVSRTEYQGDRLVVRGRNIYDPVSKSLVAAVIFDNGLSDDTNKANARLIAAAPDLHLLVKRVWQTSLTLIKGKETEAFWRSLQADAAALLDRIAGQVDTWKENHNG